jgi:hypothetical protein
LIVRKKDTYGLSQNAFVSFPRANRNMLPRERFSPMVRLEPYPHGSPAAAITPVTAVFFSESPK